MEYPVGVSSPCTDTIEDVEQCSYVTNETSAGAMACALGASVRYAANNSPATRCGHAAPDAYDMYRQHV